MVYNDAQHRDVALMKPVDCFCWSPPCCDFSSLGKHGGSRVPRGMLAKESLLYIKVHKSRATIFENVVGVVHGKHRRFFIKIVSFPLGAKVSGVR